MLKVRNLSVEITSKTGTVQPVVDLSFDVRAGETLAIVGESGCGKSMTALALMRLLPPGGAVSDGHVELDGCDLLDLSERAMNSVRGKKVAMIFQEPGTSLNPVMTVGQQIAEVLQLHEGISGAEARKMACQWLERVGIDRPEEKVDAYPFALSGGQKQRVMIAMALAANPSIVIADEPTTALDVTTQMQILHLIKTLQRERKLALIMITHDMAVVRSMADRVALMYAGQIVEQAEVERFFTSPAHPYARSLMAAIPTRGRKDRLLEAIEGVVPSLSKRIVGCRFADRCRHAQERCRTESVPMREVAIGHDVRCIRHDLCPTHTDESAQITSGALGETLLDMQGVCITYGSGNGLFRRARGVHVVHEADLSLRAGETLVLVGESGSGKTTLGKAALKLLSDVKVDGEIKIAGQSVTSASPSQLRSIRRLAQIIFQDPFASLDPRMTIGESILEGMQALGIGSSENERKAKMAALLERVGLPREAIGRLPHEFSGGQRQRVAIARALAVDPKLIVCDEPTSALDVSVQAQILNLMKTLQRELGIGYLFITHNFAVVEYMADTVAVMQKGRIVEYGRARDVLDSPRHPYTRRLLAAVPSIMKSRLE